MNNISQKIIILFLTVAAAVAGVLAFIPSIVQPPKDLEVENFHKIEIKKNVAKFSESLSDVHNDTTYYNLLDRFKIYYDERYISDSEHDRLIDDMIDEYLPIFIKQSNQKFNASEWFIEDHEKMKQTIASLRNIRYVKTSSEVLDQYRKNKLSAILDIIDSYNAAWDLVHNATYDNNSNAIATINQSISYIDSHPLCCCTELVENLRGVTYAIAESHYTQLDEAIDNLSSFSSMTQAEFKDELTEVLSKIGDYASMSSYYEDLDIPDANFLRDRVSTIEEAANAYYSPEQIRVYTNGQWELFSQEEGYDTYWSTSNHNIQSSTATMSFTISGYSSFTFDIGSRGEEGCDYVMVSKDVIPTTESCDWSTKDKDNIYKELMYSGLNPNQSYTFYVVYRKDHSVDKSSDRGYLRLPSMIN